jgi:anti-anti-sigma factor
MPAPTPFAAAVRRQPRAAIIALPGEITAAAAARRGDAYAEAEAADPELILLNFADVSYMNSTGIALIVGLLARARAARLPIAACGLSPHYQELFTITRLTDFMPVFSDETAALADAA